MHRTCSLRQRIRRWHSYTFLHPSRCWKVYTVTHGAFWDLDFTQDPTTLSRVQRPNNCFALASYQRTKIQARVATRIWVIWFYQMDGFGFAPVDCGDQVQIKIPWLLFFKDESDAIDVHTKIDSAARVLGTFKIHLSITKHWSQSQKCNIYISSTSIILDL